MGSKSWPFLGPKMDPQVWDFLLKILRDLISGPKLRSGFGSRFWSPILQRFSAQKRNPVYAAREGGSRRKRNSQISISHSPVQRLANFLSAFKIRGKLSGNVWGLFRTGTFSHWGGPLSSPTFLLHFSAPHFGFQSVNKTYYCGRQ